MQSIAELIKDDTPLDLDVLARSNDLRLLKLIDQPNFCCDDPNCKAQFELLIWAGNCERDRFGFPVLPNKFSIKCVVCRTPMLVTLSEHEPGQTPRWNITAPAPHPIFPSIYMHKTHDDLIVPGVKGLTQLGQVFLNSTEWSTDDNINKRDVMGSLCRRK